MANLEALQSEQNKGRPSTPQDFAEEEYVETNMFTTPLVSGGNLTDTIKVLIRGLKRNPNKNVIQENIQEALSK